MQYQAEATVVRFGQRSGTQLYSCTVGQVRASYAITDRERRSQIRISSPQSETPVDLTRGINETVRPTSLAQF